MLLPLLAAALAGACPPDGGLEAICGPVASEDLARVPGTHWLIASGLNIGSPAHLYLVDSRGRTAKPLFPVAGSPPPSPPGAGGACPGPIDPARMSLDGLDIRGASGSAPAQLLAANHGDRHAIEIFRINLRGEPILTWTGCIPMPVGTLANSVVALADGGVLATSFHDPRDRDAWNRMDRGEPTGSVWEWHSATGWKQVAAGIPGANGLETSRDERTLYVSAWAARQMRMIDRATGATRSMALDFRPDNIHRAEDGTLLVAGQRAAVRDIAACGASCPQPWVVARIDPRSAVVAPLLSGSGSELTNYACGAVEVDGTLFITLRGAPRIAWAPTAPLTRRGP